MGSLGEIVEELFEDFVFERYPGRMLDSTF